MHKKTLNIISACLVILIIVFSITQKDKFIDKNNSDNISVDENGKTLTKADIYKANILETVTEENINNFKKFSKTFEKNSGDNLTDSLSKDVFTQYIKYNSSGELKQDDILSITEDVLKNKNISSESVSYLDIKITTSNISNLKSYGNNVAIIQNGINKNILSLNKKNNKTPYIASIYNTASKIFTDIEVPELLAENHINIINGYKKYSEGMYMLDQQNTDPAKALIGLTKVKEATDEILNGFEKIQKIIILNKIIYTDNEPGTIWTSTNNSYNNTSIRLQ